MTRRKDNKFIITPEHIAAFAAWFPDGKNIISFTNAAPLHPLLNKNDDLIDVLDLKKVDLFSELGHIQGNFPPMIETVRTWNLKEAQLQMRDFARIVWTLVKFVDIVKKHPEIANELPYIDAVKKLLETYSGTDDLIPLEELMTKYLIGNYFNKDQTIRLLDSYQELTNNIILAAMIPTSSKENRLENLK